MKLIAITITLALALHCTGAEPERIVQSSVSLTATLTTNKFAAKDYFPTDYGSSNIHTEKSRAIDIAARNMGRMPVPVEVEAIWVGKLTGKNVRFKLSSATKEVTLAPGASAMMTASSGTVRGSDLNLVMIGVRQTEGATIEGWVVTVRRPRKDKTPGELLGIKASATHLEDWVRRGFPEKPQSVATVR